MKSPTVMSRALSSNDMRHPHAANCPSDTFAETMEKMRGPIKSPARTPDLRPATVEIPAVGWPPVLHAHQRRSSPLAADALHEAQHDQRYGRPHAHGRVAWKQPDQEPRHPHEH